MFFNISFLKAFSSISFYPRNILDKTKKNIPETIAAAGTVMTQDVTMFRMTFKLMLDNPPASPTPMTAPTSVCVVETGSPIKLFDKTIAAVENSAAKPLVGVNSVIWWPTVSMTL